jgi:hypothetical protein
LAPAPASPTAFVLDSIAAVIELVEVFAFAFALAADALISFPPNRNQLESKKYKQKWDEREAKLKELKGNEIERKRE